jgi:prepilin-type processing-associated H-X9-DG protein
VILIVSLLLAIILPTVVGVVRASATTRCGNNLRQIGVGLNLYSNDNRGRVPGSDHAGMTFDSWADVVARYLEADKVANHVPLWELKVLACPAHPLTGRIETGFCMNRSVFDTTIDSPLLGKAGGLGSVRAPSDRIWFVDCADDFNGWKTRGFTPAMLATITMPDGSLVPDPVYLATMHNVVTREHLASGSQHTVAPERHGRNRINVMYYDGHVGVRDGRKLSESDFGIIPK